ncbi:hypothetical protein DMH04_44830 [Kibdelosporangium aridum]|uniref:SnoaL-like domain-containing protein n=1 Tax=Kibdelosporangium aridum TaxID=2030 RepID=A0A428YP99_KIBAR|nr:nuclear transport factor 2 family protein [Kibdelosporangium aridum]RSM70519.1 hypothetical protein DMH04_44830 [Kibdelosporangium aridum]
MVTRTIGAEPDAEALNARAACTDVINATYRLVDEKRATSSVQLYTEDAVMELNGNVLGTEAIAGAMESREADDIQRVHIPAQTDFWLEAPYKAHAVTLLHVYYLAQDPTVIPPPKTLTRVDDTLTRSADGVWRVARRAVTVLAGG